MGVSEMGRIAELFDTWVRDNQTLAELERVMEYEHARLTTANAGLQQRLTMMDDALGRTEAALREVQGEHAQDMEPLDIVAKNYTDCPETQAAVGTARRLLTRAEKAETALSAANARAARLREALAWCHEECHEECREVRLCEDITFGGKTIKELVDDAKEGM